VGTLRNTGVVLVVLSLLFWFFVSRGRILLGGEFEQTKITAGTYVSLILSPFGWLGDCMSDLDVGCCTYFWDQDKAKESHFKYDEEGNETISVEEREEATHTDSSLSLSRSLI